MIALKYIVKFITYLLYKGGLKTLLEKQERLRNNNRVLIQINSGIGDFIRALPLIHELNLKGHKVHGIVNKNTKNIAKLSPEIKECYIVDYKIINILKVSKLIYNLNNLKFKYFIGALPSNCIRDSFLPIMLRIPIRVKHISPHKEIYRNYDFLFNKLIEFNNEKNCVVSNLTLLSLINEYLEDNEKNFNILLPEILIAGVKKKLRFLGFCEKKIIVGIHPGCKKSWSFKRWPIDNFAELINLLAIQENLQVIIFGGPDETNLVDHIIQRVTNKALNLINKLSLEETVCAISFCKIFISNDSGLMHIATVFNIPVIGLFGSRSNELRSGPYGDCHVIINKDNIKDITVSEVFEKTIRHLDRVYNNDSQREQFKEIAK